MYKIPPGERASILGSHSKLTLSALVTPVSYTILQGRQLLLLSVCFSAQQALSEKVLH